MRKINLLPLLFLGVISLILLKSAEVSATSFPFRALTIGEVPPAVSLMDPASNQSVTFDQASNKNMLMLFWTADMETKKKRALSALKVIAELQPFLAEKNIKVTIVDAGNDDRAVTKELMDEAGLALPVYVDSDQKAYGGYGIFVTPAILLIDKDGKVGGGLGYSHDMKKRLHGEIEIMLGEKTRESIEEELHPDQIDTPEQERGAHLHVNLGMAMIEKGQPELAIKEFEKALELDPKLVKAQIQIGCLYVEAGKIAEAKAILDKALEIEPDSFDAQVCRARVKAKEEGPAAAIEDLMFLKMRNSRHPNLHYVLGLLQEELGKLEEAAKEYRTAYELLVKKSHQGK